MFPEQELEDLLHLLERLSERIGQIDDLDHWDASILGEVVHPRTFNALRRVKDGDVTVLDEEEQRAELAGPEMLLKHLREMLNRQGADEVANLRMGFTPASAARSATDCSSTSKRPGPRVGSGTSGGILMLTVARSPTTASRSPRSSPARD